MSLGRKKSETQKITIDSPPPITRYDFSLPSGDRYITSTQGNTQSSQALLSPGTQNVVNESLLGLQSLARELNKPDAQRQAAINQRSQDFFDLQAKGINADADRQLAQTQSDLSKRFGGAFNATFGTDLMARLQNDRLGRLSDAHKDANLLGEDLYQNDEDSRIRRFTVFQNYLTDLNNQTRGIQSTASSSLLNEQQRASDIALQRANLAYKLQAQDYQTAMAQQQKEQQQREQMAQIALTVAKLAAAGA